MNDSQQLRSREEQSPVCRMVQWCEGRQEAERMLERLLNDGWNGAMRDCVGLWQVDVVRPLRHQL